MAEEHRCEAPPEGHHHLCANNCGFFGSPATSNLCSKCYRDFQLKEQQASSAKSAIQNSLSSSSPSSSSQPLPPVLSLPAVQNPVPFEEAVSVAVAPPVGTSSNRCLTCRKRVGLTGFKCKCGMTFCGVHRYPEKHACNYDFRREGREAIAKANPVVKAEKLDKI